MTTDRRFCRFNKLGDVPFGMPEVPEGGLCLSAFLIIHERGHEDRVLMGHLNPAAPWDHIGALDASRAAVHSQGWMLPSSHLIVNESPDEAARRIAAEQLERDDLRFSGPKVVSEVYTPRRFPDMVRHWDLEFLFRGEWPGGAAPKAAAWADLAFVDLGSTPKAAIARSHEDILASAGLKLREG
jgi:ADP-ribose pyrophosphatase YjhB (NUDIX family)